MPLIDALLLDPAPFEVWIANRTDGIKGCGKISDPFNGTQARFDAVMQEVATQYAGVPVTIHLGPGAFETKGYPTSGGWQIKAGMRILGAGMDVTTLKLVSPGSGQNFVIGHALGSGSKVDFAEVADMTIDCNVTAGAPNEFCAGYFGRVWQNRLSAYEGNWFDLSSRYGDESNSFAIGVAHFQNRVNPYAFVALAARNNFVQPVDASYGLIDSSKSNAVIFNSCEQGQVDGNVVDVENAEPISFAHSGAVRVLRIQTPAGAVIQGYDQGASRRVDDTSTQIEDALVMSLL